MTGGSGGGGAPGSTGGSSGNGGISGNGGAKASGGATGNSTGGSSPGSGGSAPGSGGGPAGGAGGTSPGTGGGTADAGADTSSGGCAIQAGSGSLLDGKTCLVWQKEVAGSLMTNKQAAKHCADLTADGFDDWRVPAPEELVTWPNLGANSNAYITNPTYIPVGATDMDGCMGNSHSCNIAEYNAGSATCAWQGVGFAGPTVCVRGTPKAGTTAAAYAAMACDACKAHVGGAAADFKQANCLPFAFAFAFAFTFSH
jgi:hypothetical protein